MRFSRLALQVVLCLVTSTLLSACSPPAKPIQPVSGLPAGTDGYAWWNDTVFYEIFVRSFYDSNGDGIGDFNGLIQKLDYLNDGVPNTDKDLGVTGLWLMPIHPAVSYHGYDVTDYFSVNPEYGTLDDFKRLLSEAHRRGIRVILDLVINHTSSQHPWFQQSKDPTSPFRSWYVWSDDDPGYVGPWGEEVWHKDPSGYYYGVFEAGMPDLNFNNPQVTREMEDVVRFWLQDVGVDGFRVDAAKHLIEEGSVQANSETTHAWYQAFHPYYKSLNPQALTVGEIIENSGIVETYSQGDQLDLGFDFSLASAILSSARGQNPAEFSRVLEADLGLFPPGQFAAFITNHDQIRAASALAKSWEKARAAAALLLTAPGVPFIYYGEEIGMLGVKPDEQIRTPMQWSSGANAGFTTATPWEPLDPGYAAERRNVADQSNDSGSLLSLYRALIQARNRHAALRVGAYYPVATGNDSVYACLRVGQAETVLVLANLGDQPAHDYRLAANSAGLSGKYKLLPILAQARSSGFTANSQGGFESYQPLPELPADSIMIFQLQPTK
jgi:glycosidase